jgi:membrane-bound lytic murein transglycosylase D
VWAQPTPGASPSSGAGAPTEKAAKPPDLVSAGKAPKTESKRDVVSAEPRSEIKAKPRPKSPKPSSKTAAKPKKGAKKPMNRRPGSNPGQPDEATRRIIAGSGNAAGKTAGQGAESGELRAIRELDQALFPRNKPVASSWPTDTLPRETVGPRVQASGMPPSVELSPLPGAEPAKDMSWLKGLTMPDIPVRWDARVVRYLEFYRNNPRGRSMVASWIKRSGRYSASIRRVLAEQGLPEDILWLALVESGFDPTIVSPAGAAGLWQFMPEGARIYGLTIDRWIDERLDPERATVAAARYLADLRQRFGGWELAFAAYNMGYGGLLASIRKYNTNDYWELARFEAGIPYETALYVPKIVAMAIVARNRAVFGVDDVELDPALQFDKVAVGSGVPVKTIAQASGASEKAIETLNPQILAMRTPPLSPDAKQDVNWVVRVPTGAGARAAKNLPKLAAEDPKLERYVVRWGESLDDIATQRGITRSALQSLNGLRKDEVARAGTVLFVPASPGIGAAAAANLVVEGPKAKPVVVVPSQTFSYADRRRVFYRVVPGDTLHEVSNAFSVTADDLRRWNLLDPSALLHEGMTLQLFVPLAQKLSKVLALEERDARILAAGTPEFFAHFEGQKGRARMEITAQTGDTWKSIAKRYGLSIGMIERINQKARSSALNPGDRVVVYVPSTSAPPAATPAVEDRSDIAVAGATPAGDAGGGDEVKPASVPAAAPAAPGAGARPASPAPQRP